jgi:hypothetical protein
MGAAITSGAVIAFALGGSGVVEALLVLLVIAAGLESILAFCIGCQIFGLLMRLGVVPDEICAECSDIWAPRATG